MAIIIDETAYDGAVNRVQRLGLTSLLIEIRQIISRVQFFLSEERNANGAAVVRELIDQQFYRSGGWTIKKSGGIDWQKCLNLEPHAARVCIGVEIQVSARSDLLTNDLTHLMKAIEDGLIDVGVIIVPADRTAYYLTDRCPSYSAAKDHVIRAKGQFSPIMLIAIGHDGEGPPLPKKRTNLGRI